MSDIDNLPKLTLKDPKLISPETILCIAERLHTDQSAGVEVRNEAAGVLLAAMPPDQLAEIETAAAEWRRIRDESTLWKRARQLSTGQQVLLIACLIRDGFGHDGGQAQVLAKRLRIDVPRLSILDPETGAAFARIMGWLPA